MKATITVKIRLDKVKEKNLPNLAEAIWKAGGGAGSTFGQEMWKLGKFMDFEVVKVKAKE